MLRHKKFVLLFQVVNDRWGSDVTCKHGDYYTCTDRYNPGYLMPHKWENCFTVSRNAATEL
jgi:alpha-L-fucosidase